MSPTSDKFSDTILESTCDAELEQITKNMFLNEWDKSCIEE